MAERHPCTVLLGKGRESVERRVASVARTDDVAFS